MSKTAVVTGANRGIGLELARQLRARGENVIAVCRSTSKELDALGIRVEPGVDVQDEDSLSRLANRLSGVTIDTLINNAGLLRIDQLGGLRADGVLEQFRTNALGPVLVTQALAKNLSQGSKVALITSRMGSIADNTSGGMYGYRMSKAALNAAGTSLAIDLKPQGVAVVILHPGYVKTEMTANNGTIEAKDAAAQLIERIDQLTLESTGRFLHANGEPLPW